MSKGMIVDLDSPKTQQKMKAASVVTAIDVQNVVRVPSSPSHDKNKVAIPLAYLPITLSTKGKLGVPAIVHCRNFNIEELMILSMIHDSLLPERIITILNGLIFEEVDVGEWPDKLIIELLVNIYANYFNSVLPQLEFPYEDEDITWLNSHGQSDKVTNIEEGKWVPRIDLDLTSVQSFSLEKDIGSVVTISKKDFYVKFQSFPHYGDVIKLKKLISDMFKEEEKRYGQIEGLLTTYSNYINEDRDISILPPIDIDMFNEYKNFEVKKSVYLSKATLAMYLLDFNGEDLSGMTVDQRIPYISRPEFDLSITKKLNKHYDSLEFGLNPMVKVHNPITNQPCTRRFVFRFSDILQAIQSSDTTEYDISYD